MSRRPAVHALVFQRAVLLLATCILLAPIAWLITTAYKPSVDIFSFPPTLGL